MKWRMAENSLFAILLRSPWWISLALAVVVLLVARLALSAELFWFGAMGGFPFLVIAILAARRQWREPGAAQVQRTAETCGAMAWREFSAALHDAWVRDGHVVRVLTGPAAQGAELALERGGRATLVSARRWKAASMGVEPMRELKSAIERAEAHDGLMVALGEVTPQAAAFAREHRIRVLGPSELAQLLRGSALPGASRA